MNHIFINGGKQIVYIARQRKGGIRGNERWGSGIWLGKFDPQNNNLCIMIADGYQTNPTAYHIEEKF
jgi:hypothetical protein